MRRWRRPWRPKPRCPACTRRPITQSPSSSSDGDGDDDPVGGHERAIFGRGRGRRQPFIAQVGGQSGEQMDSKPPDPGGLDRRKRFGWWHLKRIEGSAVIFKDELHGAGPLFDRYMDRLAGMFGKTMP